MESSCEHGNELPDSTKCRESQQEFRSVELVRVTACQLTRIMGGLHTTSYTWSASYTRTGVRLVGHFAIMNLRLKGEIYRNRRSDKQSS